MAMHINRRDVLQGAIGLASLALPPLVRAAREAASAIEINDRLAAIAGVGGNVLALSGNDGLLLVDSGAPSSSDALQAQLRALRGGDRVRTLFNTHGHIEQTGSNEVFGRAGAKIVAHEKTKLRLATDHYIPQLDRYEKARPKEAIPTEAFYDGGSAHFGDEQIEYGYLPEAHTAGDIYVFFKNSNVIAVGGALSPDRDPEFDWFAGGWIGGRIDALSLLLELGDAQTRFVAASGPIVDRSQVQAERDMMQLVYDRMADLVRKGYTTQDMLQAGVTEKLGRTLNDPYRFLYDVHKGIWAHHNTLSHDVV